MTKKRNEEFENVLQDPELSPELGPDEVAVHTAGLTHPDDLELERILAEDWESVPDHQEEAITPEEALKRYRKKPKFRNSSLRKIRSLLLKKNMKKPRLKRKCLPTPRPCPRAVPR